MAELDRIEALYDQKQNLHLWPVDHRGGSERRYRRVALYLDKLRRHRRGERGYIVRLKPELRLALAEAGYVLINCPDAVFDPEVQAGPPR